MEENFNNGMPVAPTDNSASPAQQFPDPTQQFVQPEQPQFQQPQFAQPEQPQYQQPQSDNGYQQYNSSDFTAYPTVTPAVAPKSKAPIIIAAAVVLIAAIAAVVIFVILPMLGGGYEKCERAFFSNAFSSVETAGDTIKSENATNKTTITIDLTDEITAQFADANIQLNPTTIEFLTKIADGNISGVMSWLNGTKAVTSINLWGDAEGKDMLMQLPDFLEQYIRVSTSTSSTSGSQVELTEEDIKVFEKILNEAADGYFKAVAPITTMSKGTYESDITVSYEVAQIVFTDKEVVDIALAALNACKNNPEIFDIMARFGYSNDSLNVEYLDTLITSVEEQRKSCSGTELFTMNVYMKDGTAIGRNIRIGGTKIADYLCYSGNDGIAAYFNFNYNGTTIDVKADGKKNGNASTGDASMIVSVNGEKFDASFSYKDVEMSKDKLNGTFSLSVPTVALTLDGTMTTDGSKKEIALEAYVGGTKAGTITIANDENASADGIPAKPDESTIEIIDMTSGSSEEFANAFTDTSKLESFAEKLKDDNGNYDIIGYLVSTLLTISPEMSAPDEIIPVEDTQSEPTTDVIPDDTNDANDTDYSDYIDDSASLSEYYTMLADVYDYYLKADGSYDLEAMYADMGEEYNLTAEEETYYQEYFTEFVAAIRKVASGEMTEDDFYANWYTE